VLPLRHQGAPGPVFRCACEPHRRQASQIDARREARAEACEIIPQNSHYVSRGLFKELPHTASAVQLTQQPFWRGVFAGLAFGVKTPSA